MTGTPSRTVRRLAPAELSGQAAHLLGAGWRLALVAVRRPAAPAGDPRAVYLFLAPTPAESVELHVTLDPAGPVVPDLGPLCLPAGRFARDLHALDDDLAAPSRLPRQLTCPPGRSGLPGLPTAGTVPAAEGRPFPLLVARSTRPLTGRQLTDGLTLVERLAGDTPVGHALAYCRAVEDALGLYVPEDARRMRAVLGELERLHRHLDDLATLCRQAGLTAAHAEARRLVELLLRTNHAMTGSRSLRGGILVAGAAVRRVVDADALLAVGDAVRRLVDDALDDPAFGRRLTGTATLTTAQASALGTLGVVARASGLDVDARRDHPTDVLADFGLQLGDILPVPVQNDGDTMARFCQRGTEIAASVTVLDTLVRTVNPGLVTNWPSIDHRRPGPAGASGVGISEGWRGTIVHRVEVTPDLRLADARVVDPSFFNLPALHAALDDTDPDDVPLARTSFNVPTLSP